jgi:glycosyltransferase involved in cell wall biosynthesis
MVGLKKIIFYKGLHSYSLTNFPVPKEIPKTLILVPDLNLQGGVANYYKTLSLDVNSNITYFTVNKAKPQSSIINAFDLFYKYCRFFFKLIRYRYKVVVTNPSLEGKGKSFYRELIFILIAHLLNRKVIVFFRGWAEPFEEKIRKSKLISFLFRVSYARANKFIVLGDVFKKKLISLGVPEETEFFIETTVADSRYIKDLDLESKFSSFEKEINFLFLSRIEKIKGVYIAIDAFNYFINRFPERKCSLIIAGDGPDSSAVAEYVEKKMIKNIKFLGFVSGENKRKVLLESHVMLFPSYTEGLPNTILEGMLYGMPVISRAIGGIPEVIQQNVNGFITDSYEPLVFTEFLINIASNNTLYKNISVTNHQLALKKFTSEKVKGRIIKILEGCKN